MLHPATHNCTISPLKEDALAHGFHSSAEGAAASQTAKRRFDAIFREVVAETVGEAESTEEEYRLIRSLLCTR